MSKAIFITPVAALRFLDAYEALHGAHDVAVGPVHHRGELQGYRAYLDGVAVTDDQVENL